MRLCPFAPSKRETRKHKYVRRRPRWWWWLLLSLTVCNFYVAGSALCFFMHKVHCVSVYFVVTILSPKAQTNPKLSGKERTEIEINLSC